MSAIARGSVIGLIYRESLLLDLNSPSANPTAALTLASGDADNISQSLYQLHEVWGSMIEIAVADYLLYRQMGVACAMPIAAAFSQS